MAKIKYKLETAGCSAMLQAMAALKMCLNSLYDAKVAWDKGEFECDPDHPRYREMIEALDNVGVAVFDYNRIQMPQVDSVEREPQSYT